MHSSTSRLDITMHQPALMSLSQGGTDLPQDVHDAHSDADVARRRSILTVGAMMRALLLTSQWACLRVAAVYSHPRLQARRSP